LGLDAALAKIRQAHPGIEFWLEPGRFIVAEAGVLLAQVTQVKGKGEGRYVGVATGMNSLIRPCLYGAPPRNRQPDAAGRGSDRNLQHRRSNLRKRRSAGSGQIAAVDA
jgi:diaminopimelate decarboxylase